MEHALKKLSLRGRQLLLIDLLAICISFVASFALRFDAPSAQFDQYLGAYLWILPILIVARLGGFVWLRLYQRAWRYASIEELTAVVTAAVGSSAAAYSVVFALLAAQIGVSLAGFPRSVPVIDTLLLTTLAGAWRFGLRVSGIGRRGANGPSENGLRTLIVAEGNVASDAIRQVAAVRSPNLRPIGLLADDLIVGQRFHGVSVLGRTAAFSSILASSNAEAILLAFPSARGRDLRKLVRETEKAGLRCFTLPSIAEVMAGRVTTEPLREVDVE